MGAAVVMACVMRRTIRLRSPVSIATRRTLPLGSRTIRPSASVSVGSPPGRGTSMVRLTLLTSPTVSGGETGRFGKSPISRSPSGVSS